MWWWSVHASLSETFYSLPTDYVLLMLLYKFLFVFLSCLVIIEGFFVIFCSHRLPTPPNCTTSLSPKPLTLQTVIEKLRFGGNTFGDCQTPGLSFSTLKVEVFQVFYISAPYLVHFDCVDNFSVFRHSCQDFYISYLFCPGLSEHLAILSQELPTK